MDSGNGLVSIGIGRPRDFCKRPMQLCVEIELQFITCKLPLIAFVCSPITDYKVLVGAHNVIEGESDEEQEILMKRIIVVSFKRSSSACAACSHQICM